MKTHDELENKSKSLLINTFYKTINCCLLTLHLSKLASKHYLLVNLKPLTLPSSKSLPPRIAF